MIERHAVERRRPVPRRASHDDRERVIDDLREAAGDGRIDLDELDERIERAYWAKTLADLGPLTADLQPAESADVAAPLLLEATHQDALKHDGHWVVPRLIKASTNRGSIVIDFTGATCRHRQVLLDIDVQMGSVELVVPRGWSVSTHGIKAGHASVKNRVGGPSDQGGVTLRILGQVVMSNLKIRHRGRLPR